MDTRINAKFRDRQAGARIQSASTTATATEWRFVWAVIGVVLLLTTLPVVYAYLSAPAGMQFMGIVADVSDHVQYFSWFREFMTGFLSANKLTPEANQPIFFNLLWFTLARLSVALGLPFATGYQVMYQLMRVVAVSLFLLLVYRLCSWFFPDVVRRRVAFLIVTFTSGFGWVLVVMKYTVMKGVLLNPLDVIVAEGNTFNSALGLPHLLGAALYMFTFDLMLRGQASKRWRYMVAAGLFAQFMGWQHGYDLIIVYGVIAAYIVLLTLRDRRIPWFMVQSALLIGVLSVWPSLYSFLLTKIDPLWRAVLAQFSNAGVYTPPPYRLPVLLGVPFILAVLAVVVDGVKALQQRNWRMPARTADTLPEVSALTPDNSLFIKAWFLVSFVLVYLPLDFQIHMLNGWQVPIALLATKFVFDIVEPALRRWLSGLGRRTPAQRLIVATMAVLILPTNMYLMGQHLLDLSRHNAPYYLHTGDTDAFAWLDRNAKPNSVVFSGMTLGQYVPMFTSMHSYLGHWAQTVGFFDKQQTVERFFAATTTDAERRQIVDAYPVAFVLVGDEERAFGTSDLDKSSFLTLVFATPTVKIYAVRAIKA